MSQEEQERAEDLRADPPGRRCPPEVHHGAGEDLPPELKAVEAELAALQPRTDGIDRERLIFLAGQQSVSAEEQRRARWAWPSAFAAMTAVAASLLVMFIARGQPGVEVRIVRVPVESPGHGETASGPNDPSAPAQGPPIEPLPDWREPSREPLPGSGLLALVGLDSAQLDYWSQPASETSYPRLRDRVLREGVDSLQIPSPVVDGGPAPAPVPYRKLLNRTLGVPAPEQPAPDRTLIRTLLYPGANS